MNAAILVCNIVNKGKTWTEAAELLERFWTVGMALKIGNTYSHNIVPIGMFRIFPRWKPWTKDVPSRALCAKQSTNSQDEGKIDTSHLTSEEAASRY